MSQSLQQDGQTPDGVAKIDDAVVVERLRKERVEFYHYRAESEESEKETVGFCDVGMPAGERWVNIAKYEDLENLYEWWIDLRQPNDVLSGNSDVAMTFEFLKAIRVPPWKFVARIILRGHSTIIGAREWWESVQDSLAGQFDYGFDYEDDWSVQGFVEGAMLRYAQIRSEVEAQ